MGWPGETARTVFALFAALLVVQGDFAFHGHAGDGPGALGPFAALDLVGRHLGGIESGDSPVSLGDSLAWYSPRFLPSRGFGSRFYALVTLESVPSRTEIQAQDRRRWASTACGTLGES